LNAWDFLTKNKKIAEDFAKWWKVKSFKVKTEDLIWDTYWNEEVIYVPQQLRTERDKLDQPTTPALWKPITADLATEAKKYKSADEFVDAQQKKMYEYKDWHVAPSASEWTVKQRMGEWWDFNLNEVVKWHHNQPKDYFDPTVWPRYYSYDNKAGRESLTAINKIKRWAKEITVYRTVPKNIKVDKLQDRDWITFSKEYAEQHWLHRFDGDYKIIEQKVSPKDVWWDWNDINERWYDTDTVYKELKQIREEANRK
jgi:hypothetical protein